MEKVRQQKVDINIVADSLIQKYIQVGSENEVNVSAATRNKILKGREVKDTNPDELTNAFDRAQREILLILAMDALPRFLQSSIFKAWREKEVANGFAAVALMKAIDSKKQLNKPHSFSSILSNQSAKLDPDRNEAVCYMQRAFAALDPIELPRIAKSHYLSAFLASVEGLPISVSLASASPKRRGFPLIYVNAIFAEITGYDRREIIGRNCSFLQQGKAEQKSIDMMVEALRDAKPVKVEITNHRKNGEPFGNLLAMKPIFDYKGVYSFVVGLQFDLTSDNSTIPALQMIDSLMAMLPDRLPKSDTYNPVEIE